MILQRLNITSLRYRSRIDEVSIISNMVIFRVIIIKSKQELLNHQSDVIEMDMRLKESVLYSNPLLPVKIDTLTESTVWHWHDACELFMISGGTAEIDFEHKTVSLAEGEVLVLGHSVPHRIRLQSPRARCLSLKFDPAPFMETGAAPQVAYFSTPPSNGSPGYLAVLPADAAGREATRCVTEICREEQQQLPGFELAVSLQISKLLLLLIRSDTAIPAGDSCDMEKRRLKPVLDYVQAHLNERISVEDVCGLIHMSYYYFIKFFKKVMGTTFLQYVHAQKIHRAEQLLLTCSMSVNEISNQVSMESAAHFYKVFKRLNGCSPKEYQGRMAKSSAHADSSGHYTQHLA